MRTNPVPSQEDVFDFAATMCEELNDFLEMPDLFVNATVYKTSPTASLVMIKLSYETTKREIIVSEEDMDREIKKIDDESFSRNQQRIYPTKRMKFSSGDDVYIILPNKKNFWTKEMASNEANDLIVETCLGLHDN